MDSKFENVSSACLVTCELVSCRRSLHHTRADDRVGGDPSLNFTSSGCPCCRQGRPGHRIHFRFRFRVKIASISYFT
jgi:hypothetical protein